MAKKYNEVKVKWERSLDEKESAEIFAKQEKPTLEDNLRVHK
jgi:hypothetical protein